MVLTSLKFYWLSDSHINTNIKLFMLFIFHIIWNAHPLDPYPLFQVDILVVYVIVPSCLSLKHLITQLNPCA
jgi:hypothetical protein